jgi:hypothetical protein
MRLDVMDAHAAGIEPQQLVVQAGQPGLTLGHQLGLKAALAIVWPVDLDGPSSVCSVLAALPLRWLPAPPGGAWPGR